MIKFAPNAQLTAIIDHWGDYYIARVKAVLDGTWKSTDTWEGMAAGHGGDGALHQHARRRARRWPRTTTQKIAAGTLHPFTGPITKQDGTVVGEPGKSLPDPAISRA